MRKYGFTILAKNREVSLYEFIYDLAPKLLELERELGVQVHDVNYELKPNTKIWHAHSVLFAPNNVSIRKIYNILKMRVDLNPISDLKGWMKYITKTPQSVEHLENLDMDRLASYKFLFKGLPSPQNN